VHDVRNENRATFLARAYIEGKSYSSVESKVRDIDKLKFVIVHRVLAMVKRYHKHDTSREDITNWMNL